MAPGLLRNLEADEDNFIAICDEFALYEYINSLAVYSQ